MLLTLRVEKVMTGPFIIFSYMKGEAFISSLLRILERLVRNLIFCWDRRLSIFGLSSWTALYTSAMSVMSSIFCDSVGAPIRSGLAFFDLGFDYRRID